MVQLQEDELDTKDLEDNVASLTTPSHCLRKSREADNAIPCLLFSASNHDASLRKLEEGFGGG